MAISQETMVALGQLGAVIAMTLSAVGSALGTGIAGMASIGAWKKCYAMKKPAPFTLAVFAGAPITQTFYGTIVMLRLMALAKAATTFASLLGWGIFSGLAIGISAWMQGTAAAAAADATADTGQGFTNYLIVIGITESVAIFTMVFTLVASFMA